MSQDGVAVYIHIPFCPTKCGYCDFNSYAMEGEIVRRTVQAIQKEIERSPHRGRPAKSIFFGGGTPTFLDSADLCELLYTVVSVHPPSTHCEITSEANPGTVDASKFADMYRAGFNRISIGGQSFNESELRVLGRIHRADETRNAVASARKAGFDNVNLDLMFALPRQTLPMWKENLRHAFDLVTDHLSLYCLTIEPNTPFYKLHLKNQLHQPDEDLQVQMYDLTCDMAESSGFRQYEISNFAKPGKECVHNLAYWRNEEYIAYGPGAVERVGARRWTHIKHPRAYCEAVESGADLSCESEFLDATTQECERIMLGLRLQEGIPLPPSEELETLITKGWIRRRDGEYVLTRQGIHYCNEAIVSLFPRATAGTPMT